MKYHIGIDISKKDFHVCFDDDESIEKFSTGCEGINDFLQRLKEEDMTRGRTLIGMEATGSYHLPVAYRCTQAGYTVHVINPLITRKQNQTSLRRVKTDASVAVLHENMFQRFFQQKRSEGKAYRVALCAVMRKMVHVIHAVWSRGTPFINN